MNAVVTQGRDALRRAAEAHCAAFGVRPRVGAVAPGRVNLIGEHTDYNLGLVMPLAIQHVCAAVVSPMPGTGVRFLGADLGPAGGFECELRSLDPKAVHGQWPAYVAGPAAFVGRRAAASEGAAVTIASDVPLGAGLSSSAAAEVATATAFAALWGVQLAPLELAKLCQRAEHEYAGVPCGLMDQLASVMGMDGSALLIDCADNSVQPVQLPPRERAALVVTNSGVRHALAAGEYAARRAACEVAARAMGVGSLREATCELIAASRLTDEQRDCATHVVCENDRVRAFADAVAEGDSIAAAGALMYQSHESLRDLFHVSCPELDTLVEIARSVPGVYGSRMTGGGFGGCTITLCDPGAVATLQRELALRYKAVQGKSCDSFEVRPSAGARLVDQAELEG